MSALLQKTPSITTLLLGLGTLLGATAQAAAQDDSRLAPLTEHYASYASARRAGARLEGLRAELFQSLSELSVDAASGHPLKQTELLGRAVWLSRALVDDEPPRIRPEKILEGELESRDSSGGAIKVAYRLPKDYDPQQSYPLIVAIPDVDERPPEHLRSYWTSTEARTGAIVVCPEMPRERDEWSRVMVAGRRGGLCHVLGALRFATEHFAVDHDRVYVAGRGKGVPAAVATGNYSPQRFAGIVGRSGDPGEIGPENFHGLPTYFASGGSRASSFRDTLRAAGIENCEQVPGAVEEDIWRWIDAHPRETYPERVTLAVGTPFPTRSYWLRVAPIAPDARATASIDEESNTVRITAHGVSWVTLYLNDDLVDLDRPVRILCNGMEQTSIVERSMIDTLDFLHDGTSDPAMVFVAKAEIDLTGKAPEAVDTSVAMDDEFLRRLNSAEESISALWETYEWCRASAREPGAAVVLRRIVRLDPEHEDAREALGYVRAGEDWFASREAMERFTSSQDEANATARGFVRYRSTWMHPDERALTTKGRRKDPTTGLWNSAADRKRIEQGWTRQDLNWISPEEGPQADLGGWWIDGEWLELARANRRHARIDSAWRIPEREIMLWSTADRDVSLQAMEHMRHAIDDMRRIFGVQPMLPLSVAVLRDEEQYDRLAAGDPEGHRSPTHAGRLHLVHSAYFAESWFPFVEGEREFRGMGICYWDAFVPHGNAYGVHAARLAAGLSYVEALDPSPNAVRKALAGGPTPKYHAAYETEKGLPAWIRWGSAVYAERFFEDRTRSSEGDPFWARAWSVENLVARGGLAPISDVLAFDVDPDDREASLKLMIEAGLLIAFVVDGECAPVAAAHIALKEALSSNRSPKKASAALAKALLAHENELRVFAGP